MSKKTKVNKVKVDFVSPDSPDFDEPDPFFRYGVHSLKSSLKTLEFLEFEQRANKLYTIGKLNDPRKDKLELLKEVVTFCRTSLGVAVTKLHSDLNAKTNWAFCRKIAELAVSIMQLNNRHKWTLTEVTEKIVDDILGILSDDYFQSAKVISIADFIDIEDIGRIVFKPAGMAVYQLVALIPLVLNVQALQLYSLGLKNQAMTTLFQAATVKKTCMHSHFDIFQLVYLAFNFVDALESSKEIDRAFSMLQSVMMVCERLISYFKIQMGASHAQVNYFFSTFRFFSERWTDENLEKKIPPKPEADSSEERLESHLTGLLKVRLTMAYKVLGEMLHERSMYQDAYLAMNFHNIMFTEFQGDGPMQSYEKIMQKIQSKTSNLNLRSSVGDNQKEGIVQTSNQNGVQIDEDGNDKDDFFNKPWHEVERKSKAEDGYLLIHYENEHGWHIIFDYTRKFEAILLVINVTDFLIDSTYWIDLDDVKKAYTLNSDVGEFRFLEDNQAAVVFL